MPDLNSRPNLNVRQSFNSSISANASIASQAESQFIEVSGLMDDFISIEEFAPGSDWEAVLAASWGVPCAVQPEQSRVLARIKASALRSLRSTFQSVWSKKFEIA